MNKMIISSHKPQESLGRFFLSCPLQLFGLRTSEASSMSRFWPRQSTNFCFSSSFVVVFSPSLWRHCNLAIASLLPSSISILCINLSRLLLILICAWTGKEERLTKKRPRKQPRSVFMYKNRARATQYIGSVNIRRVYTQMRWVNTLE